MKFKEKKYLYKTFLVAISSGLTSKNINIKYNGLYKGKNLNSNSESLMIDLIKKRVYEFNMTNSDFLCLNHGRSITELNKNNDYSFGDSVLFNDGIYDLSLNLINEIYNCLVELIKTNFSLNFIIDEHCNQVISEMNGYTSIEEKLIFLQSKITALWKQDEKSTSFLLFMGKPCKTNFKNWKDYIIESFDEEFIRYYLSAEFSEKIGDSYFYKTTLKEWIYFYKIKSIIEFSENEILKLKAKEDASYVSPIFNDLESFNLFNFIIENYHSIKNCAFFSCLYYFLQEKNRIKQIDKDSIIYREYIIKNGYLESYQRVSGNSKNVKKIIEKLEENFHTLNLNKI